MTRDHETNRTQRGTGIGRDRGSVMLEVSVIAAVVAICAAAALLAVTAASGHAAALGCEASRQQLQVAAAGFGIPDPASAADAADVAVASPLPDRGSVTSMSTPHPSRGLRTGRVVTTQENPSC